MTLFPEVSTRQLESGGLVSYYSAFLGSQEAALCFDWLRETTPWRQEKTRWGQPFPRLEHWYADVGVRYSYSGINHVGDGWPDKLWGLKQRIEFHAQANFNSCLVNRYRGGKDSIGYHADNEAELGVNPIIASLSLGAERDFLLKHDGSGELVKLTLEHGSLLIMAGTLQHFWKHSLPKTAKTIGERINLTFRHTRNS